MRPVSCTLTTAFATTSGTTPESGSRRVGLFLQIGGELFSKEPGRDDHVVGLAESSDHEIAQTAAYGIADQQCPGENGDRRRHAEHDGEMWCASNT